MCAKQRCAHFFLAAAAALTISGCQSSRPASNPGAAIRSAQAVFSAASSSPQEIAAAESQYALAVGTLLSNGSPNAQPARLVFDRRLSPAFLSSQKLSDVFPARRPRRPNPALERPGVGLPVVAAIGRGTPNAPSFGYRIPLTLLAEAAPSDPRAHARKLHVCQAEGFRVRSSAFRRLASDAAAQKEAPQGGTPNKIPQDEARFCNFPRCSSTPPALVPADPLRVEDVRWGRRSLPLARNLYAPLRILESSGPRLEAGIINLLRVDRFTDPRLIFLHPYDPDKIPVVLVHGLVSTPRMWGEVVRKLWEDPKIRHKFQFWVFYYPTGQPVPLSALQLRESLDAARRAHRVRQPMVLIGHSMGGILARAQVAGMSEAQAEELLPGVAALPPTSLVRRAIVFQPRTDVARVIYIATPHRGSPKADAWPARISRGLIRLPGWVRNELSNFLDTEIFGGTGRIPTSLDGLSQRSPFLGALNRARMSAAAHSIIGDRGRGDGPNSSDGIVPFQSSHIPEAESELIVPADHGAHVHPDSIQEIRRILLLHAVTSTFKTQQ